MLTYGLGGGMSLREGCNFKYQQYMCSQRQQTEANDLRFIY